MTIKNLSTKEIFKYLNDIKKNIALATNTFIDNGLNEVQAIKGMEKYFNNILVNIKEYFSNKNIKNILKIKIQLKHLTDIEYWNNKSHLERLRIDLAYKFNIPIKCIEIQIIH